MPSLFILDGQSSWNPEAIARAFNIDFKSDISANNCIIASFSVCSKLLALFDIELSSSGALNLILNLEVSKRSSSDAIPDMFLKWYSKWCADYLFVTFKKLISGAVLQQGKLMNAMPVFSSGKKQIIPNYRSIVLLSTSSKLMLYIIYKYIVE